MEGNRQTIKKRKLNGLVPWRAFLVVACPLFLLSGLPAMAKGKSRRPPPVVGEVVFGLDAIAAADRLTAEQPMVPSRRYPKPAPVIPVPAPPAQTESTSGSWDDLIRAREQARRMIEESVKEAEAKRPAPVTIPSGPELLSASLQNDLAQVDRTYGRKTDALKLVPTVSPFEEAGGGDPLDSELRAFEKNMSSVEDDRGKNRFLPVANVETISVSDEVPLLVPKRIAKVKKSASVRRRPSHSKINKIYNPLARGSTRERIVRLEPQDGMVPRMERFDRKRGEIIFPSKGRGKNVRVVDISGEEE